jgi:hypothetical protein
MKEGEDPSKRSTSFQRGQHLFRNFNSIGIVFEYVIPPFRLVLHSSSDLGNERNLEWAKMGQNGKHMKSLLFVLTN